MSIGLIISGLFWDFEPTIPHLTTLAVHCIPILFLVERLILCCHYKLCRTLPVMILEELFCKTGKQIPELCDIIVGTFVGGILGAAYAIPANISDIGDRSAVHFSPSEVTNLIGGNAKRIFPGGPKVFQNWVQDMKEIVLISFLRKDTQLMAKELSSVKR